MFLCEKCHSVGLFHFGLQSYGRCEDCGETAVCNDICIHRPQPEKTMCDDHIHEQAEMKADRQSAIIDIEVKDLLSNCLEIDRIIQETASDIANVLILNEGKANCADLVLQQIMEGILQDAELNIEARGH